MKDVTITQMVSDDYLEQNHGMHPYANLRNGSVKVTGLSLSYYGGQTMFIESINTKGLVSTGYISMPVGDFVAAAQRFIDGYEEAVMEDSDERD